MTAQPRRIWLSPPDMTAAERAALLAAFDSGWVAPVGPDLAAFEQEVAARVGIGHAAALCSGTAGLHLALRILDVGPGDEVWVSDLTFAATANAVTYTGATPVFVDADESTWQMDPDLLADALAGAAAAGTLPAAVIPVDLYGQCADYDRILPACGRYGVPVVEDAAEALGATYRDRSAGTFGRAGVFSFNGNKLLTTGGGGMLVSDDGDLVARARHLATQAREPALHYEHVRIGHNYRLSNLLAAIGRAQLRRLDELIAARRATRAFYEHALAGVDGLSFMPVAGYGNPNWWLSCVLLDPARIRVSPAQVCAALDAVGVEARPLWKPMHLQPVFAGCRVIGGPVGERLFASGVCLPSGSSLSDAERQRVVEAVVAAVAG